MTSTSSEPKGTESYYAFRDSVLDHWTLINYVFQTEDGGHFNTVAQTLKIARERRDKWLVERKRETRQ